MMLSATLFAFMGFLARIAAAHVSWTLVVASRAVIGVVVAFAVARLRHSSLTIGDRRGIWLRSIFGTAAMLCTFYAVSSKALPLGDSTTLLNMGPVFIALLSPFVLRERAGARVAIALPISLVGVVLILHPPFLFGGSHPTAQASLVAGVALAGALLSACAMMMLRQLGPKESPEAISLHFSAIAAVACAVIAIPYAHLPGLRDAFAILGSGLCAGLAQLAMTRAYALEGAARISGVGYFTVVVSATLGAVALAEWPAREAIFGMLLVICGGLVVTVAGARDAKG